MGRDSLLTSYHWRTTDTCSIINASGNINHFNVLMKFWLDACSVVNASGNINHFNVLMKFWLVSFPWTPRTQIYGYVHASC